MPIYEIVHITQQAILLAVYDILKHMRQYNCEYSTFVNDKFLVFNGCFHKYWVTYKVGPIIFFLEVKNHF